MKETSSIRQIRSLVFDMLNWNYPDPEDIYDMMAEIFNEHVITGGYLANDDQTIVLAMKEKTGCTPSWKGADGEDGTGTALMTISSTAPRSVETDVVFKPIDEYLSSLPQYTKIGD